METKFDIDKILKKNRILAFSLLGSTLIMLMSVMGCSDIPYTGPIISVDNVDSYLDNINQDTVCLQDGFDTVCVKLFPDNIEVDLTDVGFTPTVHVHPTNVAFVFEYQGEPILRASRSMNTETLVRELEDAGRVNLPSDGNNLNTNNFTSVPVGWTIKIYSTAPMNARVVEGLTIGINRANDLEIHNETQFEDGVQFAVETKASEITIQLIGAIPNKTATFHISANSTTSDKNTNILLIK